VKRIMQSFFVNTGKVAVLALLTVGIEVILPSSCSPGTQATTKPMPVSLVPGKPQIPGPRQGVEPAYKVRALQSPWTVEGVNEILSQSTSGRKALETLGGGKLIIWRVKQIVLHKQRRQNANAAWPKEWEEESLVGRVLELKGVRNVWVIDDLTNIEAALTIAHEASHTWGYKEVQARAFEVGILTEIPQYLPVAPARERDWAKKGNNRYYVDVKAITKYIAASRTYQDTAEASKNNMERLVRYRSDPRGTFPEEMDFGGAEVQGSGFKVLR
jgi:hypothetical protein